MFSRVAYDSFQLIFPVIGFFLFAGAFTAVVIRTFLMRRKNLDQLSHLPLEDEKQHLETDRHERS